LIFLGGWGYIVQQVAGLAVPLTFLKFSRGAEKEADRLGAQYMWAAGYDPNALITFFEKLQAKEKKKPGTLAKVFSTHPMTGDRITEVRELIGRFPDRADYQVSSSEFAQVKSRLLASSSSTRAVSRDAEAKRPTLKRRPPTTTDDGVSDSEPPERPTLKRRDGSQPDAQTGDEAGSSSSSSDSSGDSSGRPTLKRRDGTTTGDQTTGSSQPSSSQPSDASGKPTLKRRTDPNGKP